MVLPVLDIQQLENIDITLFIRLLQSMILTYCRATFHDIQTYEFRIFTRDIDALIRRVPHVLKIQMGD
jgi:hypothetical protein